MQFNVTTIVYGVLPIVQAVNTVCLCVNEIVLLNTSRPRPKPHCRDGVPSVHVVLGCSFC